jgi:hypothetical protein
MNSNNNSPPELDRRAFLRTAGGGLGTAALLMTPREAALAQALSEKGKLDRIASNSYPVRSLFKRRAGGRGAGGRGAAGGGGGRATGVAAPQQGQQAGAPQAAAPPAGGGRGAGRGNGGLTAEDMRKKYGEITMMDFPQFTKDTFPGVMHMDIWSSLFGDVTDEAMFGPRGFDPSTPSGRKWLDQLASKLVTTGTKVHHISNNAPNNMSGM